jgi:hypothetical protein
MTEPTAPQRIGVVWSPETRAELRAIDRETAMQILHCVDRYLANRTGDVKKLKPPFTGFRLRCGDHRVFFDNGTRASRSPECVTVAKPTALEKVCPKGQRERERRFQHSGDFLRGLGGPGNTPERSGAVNRFAFSAKGGLIAPRSAPVRSAPFLNGSVSVLVVAARFLSAACAPLGGFADSLLRASESLPVESHDHAGHLLPDRSRDSGSGQPEGGPVPRQGRYYSVNSRKSRYWVVGK